MEKLSVTIITRNEEKNLERCLNALQGVADEIVVVDSFSTDRTVEICRRYGCKVTSREFPGFGAQRQYAAGLTSHRYVMSLDADEVIDEQLRQTLIRLKERGFEHRAYAVTVRNYFCGSEVRHSGYEPVALVRLFNKSYAKWNLNEVADSIDYPDGVVPGRLEGSIHHYRCSSVEEFHKKESRIASLSARRLAASGVCVNAVSAHMRALWQFLRCHAAQLAWMDGANGRIIAARRYKTTYDAYRMARRIIKEGCPD